MSNIIRAIGYTGNLQRLVVPAGFSADITVHAWGGGGGGSGGDSGGARPGGNGGGGGFITKFLTVVPGDVLDIAVGEGGGVGGGSGARPIAYTGSTASNPWGTGIVAGTSGYYVRNVGVSGGSNYIIGYAVVVDGVIIYQADTPTAGNNVAPPPANQIVKTTLVGSSYFVTIPQPNNNTWGLPTDQDLYELVECFSFILYSGGGGGGGGGATQGGSGSAAGQSYTVFDPTPTYGGVAQVAPIPTLPYGFGYPSGTGFYTRTRRNNSDPLSYDILEWWVIINGAVVQTGGNSDWASNTYIAGIYRGSVTAYSYTYTFYPGSGSPRSGNYVPPSYRDQINAFDLYYYSGVSYCGGHGGASINGAFSGAGGGGGGATVVLLNGVIVGYAAGGGGGGGCGNAVGAGQNAPGPNGQSVSATAGSDGQTFGVGGGGGGGGGGNGGAGAPSETLAQAGAFGRNLGDYTELPNAMQPGGIYSPYYAGEPGHGGVGQNTVNGGGQPGTSGYAVVEMQSKSFQIKDSGIWKPVNNSFIKHNNTWQQIKATYVKQNSTWTPVIGTSDAYAPYFTDVPGYFGFIPRGYGT